jgi:hypothetical protein
VTIGPGSTYLGIKFVQNRDKDQGDGQFGQGFSAPNTAPPHNPNIFNVVHVNDYALASHKCTEAGHTPDRQKIQSHTG